MNKWKKLKEWLEGRAVYVEGEYFEGAKMAFDSVKSFMKRLEEEDKK